MYLSKALVFLIIFSFGLVSCHSPLEKRRALVAIDSVLDAQVYLLTRQETTLYKEALIDGNVEKKTLHIRDSASWAQELDVFRQLRLVNSPVYYDQYKIEDDLPDVNSNLRILSITTDEPIPIKSLSVYYQDTPAKIRKVEGSYRESNSIFSGSRKMTLEFHDFQGTPSLIRFRIEGGQKMVMGDSVKYTILGEITYQ